MPGRAEGLALTDLLRGVPARLATAEDTRALGVALGGVLRAGDLVLLTGDLAAGKTTLTQGIGEGLRVRGPITSPTFVIARVHPNLAEGPALVHVDAYRLGGLAELDDLDLDADLEDVVTVVEWGHGMAEELAEDRLEIVLSRLSDTADLAGEGDPAGQGDLVGEGDPAGVGDLAVEEDQAGEGDQAREARILAHGDRWSEVTT